MSSIGPFSLQVALIGAALVLAWAVAQGLARRTSTDLATRAGSVLLDACLWSFVVARVVYVAQWWPEYRVAPASTLAIGDGGFTIWAGVPVAVIWVLWRTRTVLRPLRRPVLAGIVVGFAAWGLTIWFGYALRAAAPPLPDLVLETLEGQPVNLSDYQGQAVVLNLWATWCPPCRREMPVFAQAQNTWPEVHFLMVNQGDETPLIQDFLARYQPGLRDVLRDPAAHAMQATSSRVLPTTLFFDAQGQLVDTHVGELTRAGLADRLQRRLQIEMPTAEP